MFILNKHVPLKEEVLEANQAPYMTESLRKDKIPAINKILLKYRKKNLFSFKKEKKLLK